MQVFVLNLVCLGLVISMLVLSYRANKAIRNLRAQLDAATEAQRNKDSLLFQRSELDKIKDEFISTVSHELRTPLTSIRGALGLLSAGLMGAVDAKAQNLLRIAVTNTDRLVRLINDIPDIERMESGRATLQIRRVNLRELVQQGLDTMTAMGDAAGVNLALQVTAPADVLWLDGDSDRILQVVTNLLSNAIKFSPPKTTVSVNIEAEPDWLTLRVADEGRGIPLDKLESIFDRFQQVEASDARQKGGTGLGLAICKSILQQHHGTIWAESNVQQKRGPGASVIAAFPRQARLHAASAAPTMTGGQLAHPVPNRGTILVGDDEAAIRTDHEARHVLLVEDDADLAAVIIAGFAEAGVRVDHATTRKSAMDQCRLHPPALMILDLALPDGDGDSLVEWLRQQPNLRSLPLVIYSGQDLAECEMSKLRLGPTDFLTKGKTHPSEMEELALNIVQHLRPSGNKPRAPRPIAPA